MKATKTEGEFMPELISKREVPVNRFFVYGIFLDQGMRDSYGMYKARYDTVQGFVTRGAGIVTAERTEDRKLALTGNTVSINPDNIPALDRLEGGYDRIIVKTNSGELVWMYAKPGTVGDVVVVEEEQEEVVVVAE